MIRRAKILGLTLVTTFALGWLLVNYPQVITRIMLGVLVLALLTVIVLFWHEIFCDS